MVTYINKIAKIFKRFRTPLAARTLVFKKPWCKVDIVLECQDHNRALTKNGFAYAQILDGFQDELTVSGYKCITLAKNGSQIISSAYGDVYSPTSVLDELFGLIIRSMPGGRRFYFKYNVWLYKKILLSTRCSMIVGIQPTKTLVVAAKELCIPAVDLFHGYGITPKHLMYGVDAISRLDDKFVCTDYVALDDYSRYVVKDSLRRAGHNARCWSYRSPVLKTNPVAKDIQIDNFINQHTKVFLVSLQWGIERFEKAFPHIDGELHPKIIELVTESLQRGFGFVIKPHPILLRNNIAMSRLREISKMHANVWLEEFLDLQSLLSLVAGHITIFSSTTREAAMMGVKTVLLSTDDELFQGYDYYLQCEIDSGMAVRVGRLNTVSILEIMDNMGPGSSAKESQYHQMIMPEYDQADLLVSDIISATLPVFENDTGTGGSPQNHA